MISEVMTNCEQVKLVNDGFADHQPSQPFRIEGKRVKYYAHTAAGENGEPLPESSSWQPLAAHLSNVARLAGQFAAPLNLTDEAKLAGLLHDLGKYREEFQAYLRGERGSSVETQHAIFGAAWAMERSLASTQPVAGHHAGLHDCGDLPGMLTKPALRITQTVPELIIRLEIELGSLPPPPPLSILGKK